MLKYLFLLLTLVFAGGAGALAVSCLWLEAGLAGVCAVCFGLTALTWQRIELRNEHIAQLRSLGTLGSRS